jgi:CHAT domain-containing protein
MLHKLTDCLLRHTALLWVALVCNAAIAQDNDVLARSSTFQAARARLADAETIKTLSVEGQLLYQKDRIKLDGPMYCAQSAALVEKGEFRLGIDAASKALVLGQQQSDEHLVAASKRDLAIAYSYAGDLDHAKQYALESLSGASKDKPEIGGPAYKTLGDIAVRRGKLDEAIANYLVSHDLASEKFRPLVDISLANAYISSGKISQARALYNRMPTPAKGAFQQTYQRGIGNLLLAEGKPREAIAAFTQAASDAGGSDAAYHQLWAREGIARSLLAVNDKAGARAAYVAAAQASELVRAKFRSEEFKAGLFGDVQQIFDSAISLSMEAGDTEQAWLLSEASRSRALLDVVRERVALARVGDADPLTTQALSLADVRAALRSGEALLEYHSLEDRLLVWVVRAGGITGQAVALPRQDLERQVQGFREAVFNRNAAADALGARLFSSLVAPLQLQKNERLLIVPHGALHYLPFQALRDQAGYLIEKHPLAISPSASVAMQLARRSTGSNGRLVAFGNPGSDARLALPGAEREVNRIGTLFSEKKLFLQNDASKRQFRSSAGAANILHVAAHAEVDVIDPLQSRILLAPEGNDTGFLNAREVYDVDLKNVALVTLSACESGLGRIARGDEILGFTRSFLTAGVSAMLVSLWPVGDDSTELLMTTLYGELARGADAVMSMQTAQIAVLKQAKFRQPFFWAPFNLVGDWHMRIGNADQ